MNKYTPDYLIKKVFVQTRHLVYKWERGGKNQWKPVTQLGSCTLDFLCGGAINLLPLELKELWKIYPVTSRSLTLKT